jgi:hypothetical protein
MNVQAYLDRIGYRGALRPDLPVLDAYCMLLRPTASPGKLSIPLTNWWLPWPRQFGLDIPEAAVLWPKIAARHQEIMRMKADIKEA